MPKAGRRSTLQDVADRAGVSIGTASAVFADKRWVSDSIRHAVRGAAGDLGYEPRQRRTGPAPAITGIAFVSQVEEMFAPNPYFASVLFGAQQACSELGISMIYEVYDPTKDRLPLAVEQGQVGGVILLSYASDREHLRHILDRGVACVLLEHADVKLAVDYVRHDDEAGAYLATSHLLDLGHVEPPPAIIIGHEEVLPSETRFRGFQRALAERGFSVDMDYVRRSNFDSPSGAACMAELLALPVPPTAVFCANDESALGALEACRSRGLRVPEDVSIVGFDDIPMAAHADPPLTTIAADKTLLGAQAVWHLAERLRRSGLIARDTRLSVELLERSSTAPPKPRPAPRPRVRKASSPPPGSERTRRSRPSKS